MFMYFNVCLNVFKIYADVFDAIFVGDLGLTLGDVIIGGGAPNLSPESQLAKQNIFLMKKLSFYAKNVPFVEQTFKFIVINTLLTPSVVPRFFRAQ